MTPTESQIHAMWRATDPTDPDPVAHDPGPGWGWIETLDPIAADYGLLLETDRPPGHATREAYRALAIACRMDADAIRRGDAVMIVNPDTGKRVARSLTIAQSADPEPYPDPATMAREVIASGQFVVSRANCEHPLWTAQENVDFRIAHDVYGHLATGGDFGWAGENRACDGHRRAIAANPYLSTRTRRASYRAMFTECIAQTGFAIARGYFPEQRCAILNPPAANPLPDVGGFYRVPR